MSGRHGGAMSTVTPNGGSALAAQQHFIKLHMVILVEPPIHNLLNRSAQLDPDRQGASPGSTINSCSLVAQAGSTKKIPVERCGRAVANVALNRRCGQHIVMHTSVVVADKHWCTQSVFMLSQCVACTTRSSRLAPGLASRARATR